MSKLCKWSLKNSSISEDEKYLNMSASHYIWDKCGERRKLHEIIR